MVSPGKTIRSLRLAAGLRTQKALAEMLDIPQPQVSDWESDRYAVLEIPTLVKLAKVFRCSVDQLLAGVDPGYDQVSEDGVTRVAAGERDDSSMPTPPHIPVVPEGHAAPQGITAQDRAHEASVLGWLSRPGDLLDSNAYGVQISDDSMLPAYRPKTIAILSPSSELLDGDEAYVQLSSGECRVRLVRRVPHGYMLQAYNPACKPRFVGYKAVRAAHVIVYSKRVVEIETGPRSGT